MIISLTGMMGSGKTTIGKILSASLGMNFVDMDDEIVRLEKKSINQIFAEKGEEYFRAIESKLLKNLLTKDNTVISTGGGAVISDKNIELLKQKSKVVYLKANAQNIYDRIKNDKSRPLLNAKDMKQRIEVIYNQRKVQYEKAHIIIDTDNLTPGECAQKITEKII